ncbi:MAG: hypothetical protein JWO06_2676, partial [Bacteroidota bacterium]|nr:hypothetical protein [Bacteroidota bacterium]
HIDFTQQHVIDLTSISNNLFLKFPFISSSFLFLVGSIFAIIGNACYFVFVVKWNSRLLGGTVSHFGFGVFMLGVIISQGKKEVVSINRQGINFGKDFKENEKLENILLIKDSMLVMGDYQVTYTGTVEEKPNHLYLVNYVRKDSATGNVLEQFTLYPNAQINPKMGLIANPDTKHYWTKDVFTHVSSVPDNRNLKDTTTFSEVAVKDTVFTKNSTFIVQALDPNPELPADFDKDKKLTVGIHLLVKSTNGKSYYATPVFVIDVGNGNSISSIPAEVKDLGLTFNADKIDPVSKKVTLSIRETEKPVDFIIMKAIVFPYINLVWLGGIITFFGALFSMYRRAKENKEAPVIP